MLSAERAIELLELRPLPVEGGWFRQSYRASERIPAEALPSRYTSSRPITGAIYYLLRGDDISALHRLRCDEVYHFYLGDPVVMLVLHPDGHGERVVLGPDLEAGQRVQSVVPHSVWQGSRLARPGGWALLGTTTAPAYEDADFELGQRDDLCVRYPEHAAEIRLLTRDG